MAKLKIALACQGGGSQTAFTAGALKRLCQAKFGEEFDVVGISGTSGGTETTVGTDSVGRLTIVRVAGDTATGVKIPKTAAGGMPFPIAGNIVRSMKVTLTYDGKAAQTSIRREVITFDGSSTATVTVTQDGSTKNCTLPLPRGRMSCS